MKTNVACWTWYYLLKSQVNTKHWCFSHPSYCNIKTKERENFNQEEETQWIIEFFFMSCKILSPTMLKNKKVFGNVCVEISTTTSWWEEQKDLWGALKQSGFPSNTMSQNSSACMDLWQCSIWVATYQMTHFIDLLSYIRSKTQNVRVFFHILLVNFKRCAKVGRFEKN